MGQVPRQLNIAEHFQGELRCFPRVGGQALDDFVLVLRPCGPGNLEQGQSTVPVGPATQHRQPPVEHLLRSVPGHHQAPQSAGVTGIRAQVEVRATLGPQNRQVRLADLFERERGSEELVRACAIPQVGLDDRIDVAVENRQPLRLPVENELHIFRLIIGLRECRSMLLQTLPIHGHPWLPQRGRVVHGVKQHDGFSRGELEPHHPVHKFPGGHTGSLGQLWVQAEQRREDVLHDLFGIVSGLGGHPSHRCQSIDGDRVRLDRITGLGFLLQHLQGAIEVGPEHVGGTPAGICRVREHRQDAGGEIDHEPMFSRLAARIV